MNADFFQRQVSFGEAVSIALNKYCDFTGRASRSEYWFFYLFNCLVSIASGLIAYFIGDWFSGIVSLAFLLPSLGLAWRRLHDTGRGGGWAFIAFIPIVGWIILLIWLCQPSEPYPNRFGDIPNLV